MSGRQGHSCASAGASAPRTPVAARLGLTLRLPAFVATSGVLGVGGHAAAAGMLPSARPLALGLAAVAVLGAAARRRELRFEALTALLLAGQAVLHVVLGLGGGHGASQHPALYPGHVMLLAHLLAAGVAGWWLARGEAAVWAAARRVRHLLRLVCAPPAGVPDRPVLLPASREPLVAEQVRGARSHPRRGPPLPAAAG